MWFYFTVILMAAAFFVGVGLLIDELLTERRRLRDYRKSAR